MFRVTDNSFLLNLVIFGYRWTNEMKKFPKYKESHAILGKFSQKMFKKNWIKAGRSKL